MKMICVCTLCALLASTLVQGQNPIPNPGFEAWDNMDPDDWFTSNSPGGLNINLTRTTPGHTGQNAAKGEVTVWTGTPGFPFIPLLESNTSDFGFPVTERHGSLSMYYQFHKAGPDDVFTVFVGVMDNEGSVFGGGFVDMTEEKNEFTLLEIPLIYSAEAEPYRAFVTMTINNNAGGLQSLGSYFIVDDISLGDPVTTASGGTGGIRPSLFNPFPNPADAELTLPLLMLSPGQVNMGIFDLSGRQLINVYSGTLQAGHHSFPANVRDLQDGLYICRLTTHSSVISRNIFIHHTK